MRRKIILLLVVAMIVTSLPLDVFATNFRYHDISSEKHGYINSMSVDKPAKLGADPNSKEDANAQIKDPEYPKTYTVEGDFKVRRGDRLETNFQPYIATVGDERLLSEDEKNKINHSEALPELDGYTRPTPSLDINYEFVKNKAENGSTVETNPRDKIFEN